MRTLQQMEEELEEYKRSRAILGTYLGQMQYMAENFEKKLNEERIKNKEIMPIMQSIREEFLDTIENWFYQCDKVEELLNEMIDLKKELILWRGRSQEENVDFYVTLKTSKAERSFNEQQKIVLSDLRRRLLKRISGSALNKDGNVFFKSNNVNDAEKKGEQAIQLIVEMSEKFEKAGLSVDNLIENCVIGEWFGSCN